MASKRKGFIEVVVVFRPEGSDDLNALTYGDGSPRVYHKDELDDRLDLGVPYYRTFKELLAKHKGSGAQHPAQLDAREAHHLGFK